tara:strand:- start:6666 stop:9239 length:2574 start_codon:yes stop_codon:yes gene_type:complete
MNSKDIRNSFIKFFEGKEHKFIRSSSVVPHDDPTLLFTNAGMNQFKPIFLGQKVADPQRATNSQKCIRVSGKHNDLEEVGVDTFHHTFFEMLGNWSFGDYYKKEAIQWSWELFTEEWKLDKGRLWVTVYEEDDEAYDLWKNSTDILPERIIRSGKKDNFWEMGETGPCGPCSEIHYYVGDHSEEQDASGVNVSDEYWELWNLVFIQNNRNSNGTLEELPEKHVDTGAGLERIATVIQGKKSNYDTDLFLPLIKAIQDIANSSYEKDPIPHRVIADHIRMLCFSIADGALPANDGRGYVLRRILRRAARFGRSLGVTEPFLSQLVSVVGDIMGDVFPEVNEKQKHIEKVINAEEISFNKTLDRGLHHFENIISDIKGSVINGADAFKLYDTYGFPLDLTELLAREKNLSVDIDGFDDSMTKQKQRAKKAGKFISNEETIDWVNITQGDDSVFLGYDSLESESQVRRYALENDQILIILDKTPFYAESGGQVADKGTIIGSNINLTVIDVKKHNDSFIHICKGSLEEPSKKVLCTVDKAYRIPIRNNHTATHLLHKALRSVLGDHVNQAGSLVHPDYLRFDLTHFEKITDKEIARVESIVNTQIQLNIKLEVKLKKFDEAKKDGAEALFGEKYGDEVRVVQVGSFSMELCGGTHVERTGDIGSFKIIEESSLASGVRRIVALTGQKSIELMQTNTAILNSMQNILNTPPGLMSERIGSIIKDKKELEKKLKKRSSESSDLDLFERSESIDGKTLIITEVKTTDIDELKSLGDQLYNKLPSGIGVLFSKGEEKPFAVIVVSKDLNQKEILAGRIAKEVGGFIGGGGGGKPHLATAGGKDNGLINEAIRKTKKLLIKSLSE